MCVRYQVSDQAGAPIVNSVLQEAGIISPSDKLFVIDKNKLKRQRNKYRQEIRAKKTDFLNWSMAYMLMADKMQLWF